jgi:hypothetical protein
MLTLLCILGVLLLIALAVCYVMGGETVSGYLMRAFVRDVYRRMGKP